MLISLVVKELLIAVYCNWTLVGNLLKLQRLPFLLMFFVNVTNSHKTLSLQLCGSSFYVQIISSANISCPVCGFFY